MKWALPILLCTAAALGAQEPLTVAEVAANRQIWPREVTIDVAHQVPLVVNGKTAGTMQASAGRTYPVKSITADAVQVDAIGTVMSFPASSTDLLSRASAIQTHLAEKQSLAAAATPPPVEMATPGRSPAVEAPPSNGINNVVAKELDGQLVALDGRKLESFDAGALGGKKYLGIYFSASWCPPCQKFTPELVSWYRRKKSSLDTFDIIFVSRDKTEEAMFDYMKDDKMAWPALSYENASKRNALDRFAGHGIPCLVIVDQNGIVLSHSYVNDEYVGPTKVMQDFDRLLREAKTGS